MSKSMGVLINTFTEVQSHHTFAHAPSFFSELEIPCEVLQCELTCNPSELCMLLAPYFGFGVFASPASKDNKTNLTLVKDFEDETAGFVQVYGRPTYFARNMTGKPLGLLRYGYPGDDDEYFDVFYNSTITNGSDLVPHKHFVRDDFGDDDFFQVNNSTSSFQELLRNYTFALWYSGMRWYGQIVSPALTPESFAEEEFHAFWANSFRYVQKSSRQMIIRFPSKLTESFTLKLSNSGVGS